MNQTNTREVDEKEKRLVLGAEFLSPRLSNLDEERKSSMADEGGTSAAYLENRAMNWQKRNADNIAAQGRALTFQRDQRRKNQLLLLSGAVLAAGLGWFWIQSRSNRATTQ